MSAINDTIPITMCETQAIREIMLEYRRATELHGPFQTQHEGFAVILEELDELKAEVWKKPADRDPILLRKEACQVAAMALRFMLDLTYPQETTWPLWQTVKRQPEET